VRIRKWLDAASSYKFIIGDGSGLLLNIEPDLLIDD